MDSTPGSGRVKEGGFPREFCLRGPIEGASSAS